MQSILKDQIETPALVIDMEALEANIKKMADFFVGKKAKLRPHFKTHKSPAIAHMQIAAGAKGITCAKLGEAEVLAAAGIKDILIANQIVDERKLCRLAGIAKAARFGVCVDNAENVRALSEAAKAYGSTICVLVEVDVGMGRCGVDTKEEVLALAKQIDRAEGLVFEGIQSYAGQLSHRQSKPDREKGVAEAVAKISAIIDYLGQNGLSVNEVSGGSTGTHSITGDNTVWTEIQAGSYVFMDSDYEQLGLGFEQSMTILATVIHKRPGVAVTDEGQKVCCQTMGSPPIKGYPGLTARLSEEHGTIADAEDRLSYLQKLEYIPTHCCTTANLHDDYYCVRKGLLESVLPVSARGKAR